MILGVTGTSRGATIEQMRKIRCFIEDKQEESRKETSSGVFKKFVVATVQGLGLSFSSNPKIHGSRDKAEEEAYRLANSLHGTRFAVCEVVSTVCVGEVDWEKA